MSPALPRAFFDRDVADVARDLLGRIVVHEAGGGVVGVRLTEVEAYRGEEDPASHAFRGMRRRNATMFGPPGHLYVYFTYGMHWCANLVCGPAGTARAVLLRAGQVVEGIDLARARRPAARRDADLARGPARLATCLGFDGGSDGLDACAGGGLRVLAGLPAPAEGVRTGPRVGVAGAGAASPWRWWLAAEPSVSAYRPGKPRRRAAAGSETLAPAAPPVRP